MCDSIGNGFYGGGGVNINLGQAIPPMIYISNGNTMNTFYAISAPNVYATNLTGTLLTPSQPYITSVGNLLYLNVWTYANASNFYGTLSTPNQPLITNVGALVNLTVTGTTSSGFYLGDGGGLTNLAATSIGTVATAQSVTNPSQPNITSVGTLTSLAVTNDVTAGWFVGSGNTLSNLNVSNVATGALATTYLQNNQTNITSVGTLTSLAVTGAAAAGWFMGSGNTLSNLNASNVAIGALSATQLQAAQTNITSVGTLTSLAVTGAARAGWFAGSGNTLSNLNASNVIFGILPDTTQATNLYVANTLTTTNRVHGTRDYGWRA